MNGKALTTDEWVKRLNQIEVEMHAVENAAHPSAWSELNADLMSEWRKLAVLVTHDPPKQLDLGL